MSFTFLNSNPFAKGLLFIDLDKPWRVKILDNDSIVWHGEVIGVSLQGTTISVVTESEERETTRQSAGANFSLHCWKIFKSPTCGYVGEGGRCGLTVGACQAYGNYINFGGFPHTPKVNPSGLAGIL